MGKKKVLIITYIVPYPADAGGKISIFGTINYLRFHFDITLVVRASNKQDKENVEILRSLWPEVTIETADYYKGKNTMHLMLLPFYKLANTMMDTLKNAIVRHAVNVEHNKIDIFPYSTCIISY